MRRTAPSEANAPVFLHIGAMKTGSTYIQQLLMANRQALADEGYLFPGRRWIEQVRAAQDAVGIGRKDPKIRAEAAGAWDRLAGPMRQHRGRGVVMSMEFLSFATPKQARRVVRSLAPAPVHVLLTVRDAAATIPSQWQTSVRTGSTISWPDYMAGVRTAENVPSGRLSGDNLALRSFLRAQDTARILNTWAPLLPPGRLHVITVPRNRSGPDGLWERFARAAGIPASVAARPPKRANESLGLASTELLRRVNLALGKHRRTEYNRVIKDYLAAKVLTRLAIDETSVRIDAETAAFASRWNGRAVAAIKASGADVVGDLEDLPTAPRPEQIESAEVSAAELSRAAAVAEEALQTLVRRLARRADPSAADATVSGNQSVDRRPEPADRSVDEAVAAVAALAKQAIQLRRHLRATPRKRGPGGRATPRR